MTPLTDKELNGMSIREIYSLWKEETDDTQKNFLSAYMVNRLYDFIETGGEELNEYDLSAAIKIAGEKCEDKDKKRLVKILEDTNNHIEKNNNLSPLQKALRRNSIAEALEVLQEIKKPEREEANNTLSDSITSAVKTPEEITSEDIYEFNESDKTGGLEHIDPKVVEQLRQEIVKMTKFMFVDGNVVAANDCILVRALNQKGYDMFAEIKGNVIFKERTKDKDGKDVVIDVNKAKAAGYLTQLKRNALLRATYDLLLDKKFYETYSSLLKNKDDKGKIAAVQKQFQEKVAQNFKRSLVLARITTTNADLLKNISINTSTGKAAYVKDGKYLDILDVAEGDIQDIIADVESDKEIELHPYTVGMDKYDLDMESAKVDQVLESKSFADKVRGKLKWLDHIREGVKGAWDNIRKDWKRSLRRFGTGFLIVGGSTALISSGSWVPVVAGMGLYTGYSYWNAKVMPIYDRIMAKMKFKHGDDWKKLSRKNKHQQIKENWKPTKLEMKKDAKFNKRSNWRFGEGATAAGLSGIAAMIFTPLVSRFVRQGVLATDKTAMAISSEVSKSKARKQYIKQGNRRLAQYKEIQDLGRQAQQDWVNVGATVLAAAYVDSGAAAYVHEHTLGAAWNSFGDNQSNNGAEQENPEVEKTSEQIEQEAKEARWADNQAKLLQEAGDNHNFGTDPKQFDGYTLKMYNAAGKFSTVQHDTWLQNFADGKIDSRPEGMSPMQYIRAYELLEAFGHDAAGHPDAEVVKAIRMDLNCDDDYVPTPEMNERIKEVLGKVVFENKSRLVIIQKGDCLVEYNEYGHMGYMDAQKCGYKQVVLDDGRTAITKSTLTLNRIKGMEVANIDCDDKTVGISKIVQVRPMPCDNQPVIEERVIEKPVIEKPIIETPVREPQNFAVAPSNDIRFESEIPGTADEIQIHSSKGNSLQIDRKTATESLLALHSDVADSLKASEDITVEQLKQIDKMLGINGGVDIDKDNPWNSKIKVSGTWKENGVDTDNVSVGTVRMTAQMWHESLNGNYGSHTVAQNIDVDKLVENAQNIKYSHSENGQDYYDTGITDKKGNAVRFAVPSPVNINMDAEIVAGETSDGGREYACQTTDGSSVIIKLKGNSVTISDEDGRQGVIIAPQDRAPLTEAINQDLAALPENNVNKGGKVDLNPDRNSPQAAYEHSRYPDLVPFGEQQPEPQAAPQHNGNQQDYFQERYYPGRYGNTPDAVTAQMDLAMMVRNATRGGK